MIFNIRIINKAGGSLPIMDDTPQITRISDIRSKHHHYLGQSKNISIKIIINLSFSH